MNKKSISALIPKTGKELSFYSGTEIIDRLGEDVIRSVVASILSGGNVRSLTESLTRRRLNLSNGAMLITFLSCLKNIDNFSENLNTIIADELNKKKNDKETKIFLNWIVGLTGKSIQNVLRSDDSEFQAYLTDLNASLEKSVAESSQVYGELSAKIIDKENQEYFLKWPELLQLFTAIGAQTLTIRGSEKSMYGKFFEKLVLGSLLSVLGFKLKDDPSITKKTFWLSQREDKRESDATLILEPGIGVRFDIGFIGPGNTEISLDKVSRFEREIEMGRQKYYMSTIILVDRIGERSRIVDMAKNIDGTIIQMSMSNWVKEVATVLKQKANYKSEILSLSDDECKEYIEKKLNSIDLHLFI